VRYLLDTCIVVAALRSRLGASNRVLRLALERRIVTVMHYKLLSEYRDVLSRRFSGGPPFTPAQLETLLASLADAGEEVDVRYLWRPNLRDEGDNFIYEIAVAASPCTIVSHNVRDFAMPETPWSGILVKTPQQVIREMRAHA